MQTPNAIKPKRASIPARSHAIFNAMNSGTNIPTQANTEGAAPPRSYRLSAKVRNAIHAIVQDGATQRDAANRASMNEVALSRALARPAVREYLNEQKALFACEIDELTAFAKKRAIMVGLELMNSGPPAQRVKMVELFTVKQDKKPSVLVQNNVFSGGYEYAQPGAHVVEIIQPGDDSDNGVPDAETLDNKGD